MFHATDIDWANVPVQWESGVPVRRRWGHDAVQPWGLSRPVDRSRAPSTLVQRLQVVCVPETIRVPTLGEPNKMNKSRTFGFSACTATLVVLGNAGVVHAQQPGTNMETPPPISQSGSFQNTQSTQGSVMAAEPVIAPETTKNSRPNRPLLITGLVFLGGAYGASAIVAGTSNRTEDEKLYYPVVGPWMDLNDRDCNRNPCSNKTLNQVLLVGDGVVQGLGALSLALSIILPEKTTRSWYLIGNDSWSLTPQLGRYLTGVGAVGRF